MRYVSFVSYFVAALLSANGMESRTIHVPADSSTIQSGINGGVDGDTVLVADGIYTGDGNRDIDFGGKAIVVASENGPENCVIDCQGSESNPHRGFYFHSAEDTTSVLQGFTIQNGYAQGVDPLNSGGGILCVGSGPTIVGNIITMNIAEHIGGGILCRFGPAPLITQNAITDNVARYEGGGIFSHDASPRIEGNIISENSADESGGGLFFAQEGSRNIILVGNTITGNAAGSDGGGVACSYVDVLIEIEDNAIAENTAADGGGIFLRFASPLISGNFIEENVASNYGGGIDCHEAAAPTISDNIITGNQSSIGGGIRCGYYSTAVITGNVIAWNSALEHGGGISCRTSYRPPTLRSNTIAWNTATRGGGFYFYDSTALLFTMNMIFWGNEAAEGPAIWVDGVLFPTVLIIRYSDVEGGEASIHVGDYGYVSWEEGMITRDPRFVDPGSMDVHLLSNSPCIDSGDPSFDVPTGGGCRSDMGAFEYWKGFNCHKNLAIRD